METKGSGNIQADLKQKGNACRHDMGTAMSRGHRFSAEKGGGAEYASADDFRQFFKSEATALMQLALILTAEPGKIVFPSSAHRLHCEWVGSNGFHVLVGATQDHRQRYRTSQP